MDAQILRVEDVAVDRQDVAVRRDEDAGAVGGQAVKPPAPKSLTIFWLTSSATLANDSSARRRVEASSKASVRAGACDMS